MVIQGYHRLLTHYWTYWYEEDINKATWIEYIPGGNTVDPVNERVKHPMTSDYEWKHTWKSVWLIFLNERIGG